MNLLAIIYYTYNPSKHTAASTAVLRDVFFMWQPSHKIKAKANTRQIRVQPA